MSSKCLSEDQIIQSLNCLEDGFEDNSDVEIVCENDFEDEDNLLPDEADSSPSSSKKDVDNYNDDKYITSREWRKWRTTPSLTLRRSLRRNILRVVPGITNASKNITTPLSAFHLLFDASIMNIIIDCSENKAENLGQHEWKLKREAVDAFIGMLVIFGATRGRKKSIKYVWSKDGAFCQPVL